MKGNSSLAEELGDARRGERAGGAGHRVDDGDAAPAGAGGWGPTPEGTRELGTPENKFVGGKVRFLEIK